MPNDYLLKSRESRIINANYDQSTHNVVTSNAAATRLLEIAHKYLPLSASSSGAASSSTSNQVSSISTAGDVVARRRIEREIDRYLNRKGGGLEPATKQWLREQLKEGAPLDSILDKITLTHQVGDLAISTEWYLPLREVFVIVFKALTDNSDGIWPVPAGSTANKERLLRLREFDMMNNALAKSRPAVCSTGVRHSWLQELDGYAGRCLPVNSHELLFRVLRDFVIGLLAEQGISISGEQDPVGEARSAFEVPFKTVFLPWLLAEKMPESMMDALERAGGSEGVERSILNEFERIGVVPDSEMQKQIQNYSSKLSLEETPCDFTPFLATLYAWLKKHTGFLVLNPNAEGRNGKEKLAKQLINWLSSEHFKPADVSAASSSSSAPAHARDSIAHFYQLERLFEAMEQFQKNKIVLIAADIPADKKAAWLRACDYLQERLAETEPSVARLLAEDERLEEHLKGFEAGYKAWRENSYSDFITNFFVDWFAADDDVNKATRGKLFTTLADLYFREQPPEKAEHPVLYLSDELLGKWTEQADDAGLIHLEPYQVNRFALHALCYPPSTWTPQFREYANLLLAFIRTGFNEPDASIKIDFARDSYPESLCAQLEGLIAQYDNPNSVSSPAATLAVLTPNLISAAESFRTIHYLLAVPEASESLIKQVISNPGFNADARGGESLTPLYLAAEEGNVAVGAALIEFGADVNVRFKGRYSPLYVADEKQHHEMVRLLLDSGKIDVSASHFNGKISFYVAITSGHLHSAKRLLEQTPEGQRLTFIQTRDSRKSNVLYYSLDKPDSLKVILELIPEDQRLAVIKLTDFKSMSGLHYAIAQPEHLKALLQLIPEKQRFKAVMVAYKYGKMVLCEATAYPESLKTLLELIPEDRILEAVQKSNLAGQTVLHHAIVNPQSIKIILERVPEAQRFEAVMTMNINGFTVLQYATNNPESLKEILGLISEEQRREAVMISNKQGSTVLHFATNNPASLRVIIDLILEEQRYEAIMMTTEQGYTVLHSAAVNHESLNIILGIIPVDKRFEAVMATTTEGSTVLHFAVNSPQALKRILECIPAERRLDAVMLVNDDGWCVLSRVSMIHQSLEIVLQLIPEGQRYKAVNLMNKYGKTVMDYASAKPKSLNILHQLISALRQSTASSSSSTHSDSDRPCDSLDVLEEAFYKCYHATFKQLNHSFFSSSDEARSSSQASFAEVLRDAQNENNRNRQVCIALEWMNIDGTFNEKVPDKLRELLQVRVPYIS